MSKTILIADDNPVLQVLMEQALEDLEDEGVELLFVGDGLEALSVARSRKPTLVLLDIMMPGMNGIDVCRALKADPETSGCRVVILTAQGEGSQRELGEGAGADLYLTKPFDPDALLALARKYLGLDE